MSPDVEVELLRALTDAYKECKAFGYYPNYFLRMIADNGPVAAVKALLDKRDVSSGFARLYEAGRLDLSVEAIALDPRFSTLFTDDELQQARDRLRQLGLSK